MYTRFGLQKLIMIAELSDKKANDGPCVTKDKKMISLGFDPRTACVLAVKHARFQLRHETIDV
jgi:hypothetical protein